MHVVDLETGETFSFVHVKANMVRDRLRQNKPRMDSGMDQRSFINPNTGKAIYRENHTDPDNVFCAGCVIGSDGVQVKKIPGVKHIHPVLESKGDTVEIKAPERERNPVR